METQDTEKFEKAFTSSNWTSIEDSNAAAAAGKRGRGGSPFPSPTRKSVSPQRKTTRRSPSPSPERKSKRSPSPSPERNTTRRSPSMSPERDARKRSPSASPRNENTGGKEIRMSDGTLAGLQSGQQIKQQIERARREEERLLNANRIEKQETVYRDKTGKKVDMVAQKAEMLAERRRKEAQEEAQMEWGKGLVQKKEAQNRAKRLQDEKNAHLAVYADDRERNEDLMEKVRWGDAMASMVKKKKKGRKVVYQGPAPAPNRFGILPGYRWDGIDRSNGFELKLFRSKHAFMENKKEFQRWATEDM